MSAARQKPRGNFEKREKSESRKYDFRNVFGEPFAARFGVMNSVVQPHFVRNVRAYRVEIVHAVTVFARNVSDYFVSAKNYTICL